MKKHEFIGKNRDEALQMALEELGVEEKDLIITEKEQKGGIFKSKKTILEVVKVSDVVTFIKDSLVKITSAMGIEVKTEVKERNGILNIVLYSENNSILNQRTW